MNIFERIEKIAGGSSAGSGAVYELYFEDAARVVDKCQLLYLFCWSSSALRDANDANDGHIIVLALTADDARRIARERFLGYLQEKYDYRFNEEGEPLDEDDFVWLEEQYYLLRMDLYAEPRTSDCEFLTGNQ